MPNDQAVAGSAQTQDAGAGQAQQDQFGNRIGQIEQTQQQILEKLGSFASALTPQPKAEPAPDIGELLKKDPALALMAAVEQVVAKKVNPEFTKALDRKTFDEKADRDFPQIKNDPEFRKIVQDHMKEMVDTGEVKPDSPRLVYWAAERAALKYKKTGQAQGNGGMSGEAPSTISTQPGKADEDHLNKMAESWGKVFGIKNMDRLKERMKKEGSRK